jgi:hypothetical protein
MRLACDDMRGPHRFTQKRPRTVIAPLQSLAAARMSKNQLSRDFRCSPIFDFCNSIGTSATCWRGYAMSVYRSGPDVADRRS